MIPPLREGVHAYLSEVTYEPRDHLVHLVTHVNLQAVSTACGRLAIPFDSPLKNYPRTLPTEDVLTCMLCIDKDAEAS